MTIYSYRQPLGYLLKIYDPTFTNLQYEYNSLPDGATKDINVQNMKVDLNTSKSFISFEIENSDRLLDFSKVKKFSVFTLQISKDQSFFSNPESYALVGYLDDPTEDRPFTNANLVNITGWEWYDRLNDTQLEYFRSAPTADPTDPNSQRIGSFTAAAHLRRLMSDKNYTILKDVSPANRYGIDITGIDSRLNTFMPNIEKQIKTVREWIDSITNNAGGVAYMDYVGGARKLVATWPEYIQTPIIIKSSDLTSVNLSTAERTYISKIADGFEIRPADAATGGYYSRMFGVTRGTTRILTSSPFAYEITSLSGRAIAQPFTVDDVQFNGIGFTATRVNDPPVTELLGSIYSSKTVASLVVPDAKITDWSISINDIESGVKSNVNVVLKDEDMAKISNTGTFFIVWYKVAEQGDLNTIALWRSINNDGGSLIAQGGASTDVLDWKLHGPTFAHTITSNKEQIYSVTNYNALKEIGYVESPLTDLENIDEVKLAARYMTTLAYFATLQKTELPLRVTCPDNFLFKPLQNCRIVDSISLSAGYSMQLQRVGYDFARNDNMVDITGVIYLDQSWPTDWPCKQVI